MGATIPAATPLRRRPVTPAPAPGAASEPPWTVLIYSAGDNALHDGLLKNLIDCQKVGSSPQMNVVAQFDQPGLIGSNRYYLTRSDSGKLDSPILQQLGTTDSADPKTLADFIAWGMKTYPAQHTMLIVSDHGDAWRGAVEDDGSGSWMTLPQLQQALQSAQRQTGKKLDVLGFDTCLMASTEVATQLQGQAHYLVASEENEGASGWPYPQILSAASMSRLARGAASDAAGQIVQSMVTDEKSDPTSLPTMSAIDLTRMPAVTASVKGLADALLATSTPLPVLQTLARDAQPFHEDSDLYDFASRLKHSTSVRDPGLKAAAAGVMAALRQAIVAEQHAPTVPRAHGLSINLEGNLPDMDQYRQLASSQGTGWDKVLDKLYPPT